jgi:hypothetical protein
MSEQSNGGYYEAYWPRTPRQTRISPLAPRLKSLEGKTIAFLWDEIFRGDEIFAILEETLSKRYSNMRFIGWREFGSIHGGKEREVLASLPQRLKELQVDGVICGMAC